MGIHRQPALQTGLAAGSLRTFVQTSDNIPAPIPDKEDNAADYGKGTPFATKTFKRSIRSEFDWSGRLTSETAAWLGAFAINIPTKASAGTGFKYTSVVGSDFTDFDNDRPVTTFASAMRQGASSVFDFALIGCACEEMTLSLKEGLGRDTATISSHWIGCGKYSDPSGLTLPAPYDDHGLNFAGATALSIISEDYVTSGRLLSADLNYKNNIPIDRNYRGGGGLINGFPMMARMRSGIPSVTFRAKVELEHGSGEWGKFLADTEGTIVLTLKGDVISGTDYHQLAITLHKAQIKSYSYVNDGGYPAADIEASVQLHSSNGVLTWETKTGLDEIGALAA